MPRRRWPKVEGVVGELRKGEIIIDKSGDEWKLGKAIGIGGFGEIYDVASCKPHNDSDTKSKYVAKIEKHSNGPLFVEINCYLRLGKQETIDLWKSENNLSFLGMPHFVASGSHLSRNKKYRFLILPKYEKDLEAILRTKRIFNLKTVLVIASRIIDTLEYIHSHGYVHSDIKAPNIMLSQADKLSIKRSLRTRRSVSRYCVISSWISPKKHKPKPLARTCNHILRPVGNINYCDDSYLDELLMNLDKEKTVWGDKQAKKQGEVSKFEGDQIYLLDYGLATKYILTNGEHREFGVDHRRAHAGTIQFCSRDAHKGVASRRSDLESLAYNMIYWLTGTLPWVGDVDDPELVEKKKNRGFNDVKTFLEICFEDVPRFLVEMFTYLSKLNFQEAPNYDFFRQLFKKTIKDYGFKEDWKLDFDNLEGWGRKQKKTSKVKSNKKENQCIFKSPSLLMCSPLKPLSSNVIFKRPKLRKKINHKLAKNSMMNWSKILVMDPETIIKAATNRQKSPDDDRVFSISERELQRLNPTPAMREVFSKLSEKLDRSPYYRSDELTWVKPVEGYTAEMMRVHRQTLERKKLETELAVQQTISSSRKYNRKRQKTFSSPTRCSKNPRTNVALTSQHCLRKVRRAPTRRA